ncbi:MAG: hypothetical protein KBC64_07535 [Simkaniaceae bacterium]|nr:hypothetical protein [Simkaniaceae bacterium]
MDIMPPVHAAGLFSQEKLREALYSTATLERIRRVFDTVVVRPKAGDIFLPPPATLLGTLKDKVTILRSYVSSAPPPADLLEELVAYRERAQKKFMGNAQFLGERYLEVSYNYPNPELHLFLQQKPSTLRVRRLRDATGNMGVGSGTTLFPDEENWRRGLCMGMCQEFLCKLYHFCDVMKCPMDETSLRAVASEFCTGASETSLLLQAIHNLFGEQVQNLVGLFQGEVSLREFDALLEDLALGAYEIRTTIMNEAFPRKHAVLLFIVASGDGDRSQYLFDPNHGLIKATGELSHIIRTGTDASVGTYEITPITWDLTREHLFTLSEDIWE